MFTCSEIIEGKNDRKKYEFMMNRVRQRERKKKEKEKHQENSHQEAL